MKLKIGESALLLGLLASLLISGVTAFAGGCEELRGNVLRLHILANSNQPYDQQIKLEARDAILREVGTQLESACSQPQAKENADALLKQIEEIAHATALHSGYDYPVKARIVRMYFETRTYGNITMPAGMYDAVRVEIGQGQGHNWWCVLYPPVCIPAAGGEEALEGTVAMENPQYEPRFKIVEMVEQIKAKFSGENASS